MAEYQVTSKEYPILDLVLQLDEEYYVQPDVYEFSNGRKFKCTDNSDHGVYDGS